MEKKIKITSGVSLSKLIEAVIDDTLGGVDRKSLENNAAREREYQNSLSEEDDLFADDDAKKKDEKSAPPPKKEEAPSATTEDEKSKLKKGDVETDDIVTKLNTIRSGKSFKDEAIASKLDEYVKSLSGTERTALFAFLKGISQVVTGEISPDDAQDPSEPPSNIKMQRGGETVKIKPTIVKKPEQGKKRSTGEDTSGPVPIKPKA